MRPGHSLDVLALCGPLVVEFLPTFFDPVLYIAELRGAGHTVYLMGGTFGISDPDGLGEGFERVCFRWAPAMKREPNYKRLVKDVLKAEQVTA